VQTSIATALILIQTRGCPLPAITMELLNSRKYQTIIHKPQQP
jgi:hypothetical protein